MKFAIIGATGKAGSLIAEEALNRGHQVLAIARDEEKAEALRKKGAEILVKGLFDLTYEDLASADAVIDAFGTFKPGTYHLHIEVTDHLVDILSGKPTRLLVIGGAASLYVDSTHRLRFIDRTDFPDPHKSLPGVQADVLTNLRPHDDVNWTYVTPPMDFRADGARTGAYKLAGEELSLSSQGESQISYADYAIAMVDEAESGAHVKERISIVAQ